MSVNWYPIMSYENCIENCRSCQQLCPSEAIEYAGDNSKDNKNICSCDCGRNC